MEFFMTGEDSDPKGDTKRSCWKMLPQKPTEDTRLRRKYTIEERPRKSRMDYKL